MSFPSPLLPPVTTAIFVFMVIFLSEFEWSAFKWNCNVLPDEITLLFLFNYTTKVHKGRNKVTQRFLHGGGC
jgi:hypothetical protein